MTAAAPQALTEGGIDADAITDHHHHHLLHRPHHLLPGAGPPLAPGHAPTPAATDAPLAVDVTTTAEVAEVVLVVPHPAVTGPTLAHSAAHQTDTQIADGTGLPPGPAQGPDPGHPSAGAGPGAA